MSRVYVLINVKEGMVERVVEKLQKETGVLLADIIERPPDIIMVVQALNQERLTKLTIRALAPVENYIEGLQILPVLDSINVPISSNSLPFCNN